ncbi:Alanine racemase 1 [subsurface metagenome]
MLEEYTVDKENMLSWAEVNLGALTHNVEGLRQHLRPGTQLMAIVKKNAYGHGAIPIAESAVAAGADWLGVHSLEEGLELRAGGVTTPILIMGPILHNQATVVLEKNLTPTVTETELASALDSAAREVDTTAAVHVKVDTGLNRFGTSIQDITRLLHFISSLRRVKVSGVYTHFASADEPDRRATEIQLQRLLEIATTLPEPMFLHAANSAATLRFPETHLNLVRVGIAMYGAYPSPATERTVFLRPVLSLKSRVARVHWVRPGEGVSYGLTWTARKNALVALIPFGYGHGLPRLLSNRGQVLVHGQRAPIRGRVCMDQCIIDVTTVPGVKVGDEVVLLGSQGSEEINVDEIACWANTISYEVFTGIWTGLPRIYV